MGVRRRQQSSLLSGLEVRSSKDAQSYRKLLFPAQKFQIVPLRCLLLWKRALERNKMRVQRRGLALCGLLIPESSLFTASKSKAAGNLITSLSHMFRAFHAVQILTKRTSQVHTRIPVSRFTGRTPRRLNSTSY